MATITGISHPNKRESRPDGSGRLPECLLGGDVSGNSTADRQAQFLQSHFHLRPAMATVISGLLWSAGA